MQLTNWGLNVFPNPASGEFNLQLNQQPSKELSFKIFDATGRLIFTQVINFQATTLNRSGLANGVYFYVLESETQLIKRGKLILY